MKILKLTNSVISQSFVVKTKILFFLFVFSSFLEILGIGLFIPLLTELTSSEFLLIEKFKTYLKPIYEYLNFKNWIILFLLLIILTFLIKNLLLAFISFYENRYVQNLTVDLSTRLLKVYLLQNYLFHKKINSSELIRNINIEISTFIVFLKNLLILVSQTIFTSGIIILLLIYNAKITLFTIFIFFILISSYFFFSNQLIERLGKIRFHNSDLAIKVLQQSFGAIKEIKVNNLESLFTGLYKSVCQKIAVSVSLYSFLQQLPRLILEFFIIAIACFWIIFLLGKYDSSLIFVNIGLFSITAIKLFPSFLKIYQSIQGIVYSLPSLKILSKELNLKTNIRTNKLKNNNIFNDNITFKKVFFRYQKKLIIKNFNLKLSRGEKIAIVGSSGVGKTTFVELLMGLIFPNKGQIYVDKYNINECLDEFQKIIGYVPQDIYLIDDTVLNNITLFDNSKFNEKFINEIIKKARLKTLINKLPNGVKTIIGERGSKLSKGQRQRLAIARALYKKPKILILDEPTSALDKLNEKLIINAILKMKKITVIVITHNPELLKKFDKVVYFKNNNQVQSIKRNQIDEKKKK